MRPSNANRLRLRRHPRPRDRGQGIVEFALVLPLLILILLFAIDAGRLFFGWVALQNTSRIGANVAAMYPTAWSTGDVAKEALYNQAIQDDASTINCALPSPIPTPNFPDSGASQYAVGSRAVVSLQCRFTLLTPIIGDILGNPISLGATTTYPIRAGIVGLPTALPTPTPAPTPTPTPTATPRTCQVPTLLGVRVNPATQAWKNAGFDSTNFIVSIGSNNYTIGSVTPFVAAGTAEDCSTFSVTVGP